MSASTKDHRRTVPQIRFQGFDSDWEKKKLGNMFNFKNGINAAKEKYGKGYKFINVLDIIENNYITYEKIKGSVEITENEYAKNIVEYGDILFQRSSETREEVGQANVYLDKENSATFGGFVIMGKKMGDYDPVFMNYLLKTPFIRRDITSRSGGSTRYNIGQASLAKVVATLPSMLEQQKIADFLSAVDNWIENLEQQKEKLEAYKKGIMQKIFSQEIRFKDENGKEFPEWEKRVLGDIVSISSGHSPSEYEFNDMGEYPFLKVEDLNLSNKYLTKSRYYSNDSRNLINKNSIIFPKRGAAIMTNKIRINRIPVSLDTNLMALKTTSEVDCEFLYFSLDFFKLSKLADTSSIPQINNKHILPFKIQLPTLLEQQKIALFLRAVDTQIESVTKQINQVEIWKKGLLQKLFV